MEDLNTTFVGAGPTNEPHVLPFHMICMQRIGIVYQGSQDSNTIIIFQLQNFLAVWFIISSQLTVANNVDISPVVAVIDTPARETALGKVSLIAKAIDLREPDNSSSTSVCKPIAGTNCLSVAQHSGEIGDNIIYSLLCICVFCAFITSDAVRPTCTRRVHY